MAIARQLLDKLAIPKSNFAAQLAQPETTKIPHDVMTLFRFLLADLEGQERTCRQVLSGDFTNATSMGSPVELKQTLKELQKAQLLLTSLAKAIRDNT